MRNLKYAVDVEVIGKGYPNRHRYMLTVDAYVKLEAQRKATALAVELAGGPDALGPHYRTEASPARLLSVEFQAEELLTLASVLDDLWDLAEELRTDAEENGDRDISHIEETMRRAEGLADAFRREVEK